MRSLEPKDISINNGATYISAQEAVEALPWSVIERWLDPEVSEEDHDWDSSYGEHFNDGTDEANVEYLEIYLRLSPCDLIIG